jgi:F0F1-type ATP synthase epsilon subunit
VQFTIITPFEKKQYAVAWLEVNTPIGNFVIQPGHAPTILTVSSDQPFTMCLHNGKQETFTLSGNGILKVTRREALLLITA